MMSDGNEEKPPAPPQRSISISSKQQEVNSVVLSDHIAGAKPLPKLPEESDKKKNKKKKKYGWLLKKCKRRLAIVAILSSI